MGCVAVLDQQFHAEPVALKEFSANGDRRTQNDKALPSEMANKHRCPQQEAHMGGIDIQTLASATHEALYRWQDDQIGVVGFTAIHSTALGPAFGGARLWRYSDEAAARTDALRLSEGMTYKNAMAELRCGGGKSVLWVQSADVDREALFTAFGRVVQSLAGRYVTAEDVGTGVADMQTVRRQTPFVAGLPAAPGRAGGDPSPWTALGVFCAMEAALASEGGRVEGSTVAVQGVGAVGEKLCGLLHEAGARLIVADAEAGRAERVAEALGATVAGSDHILRVSADVLAPCALGGVLNDATIPTLGARLIVGAANNQLRDRQNGYELTRRGVIYAPDFVVNAGGIINAIAEYRASAPDDVERDVRRIGERLSQFLSEARQTGTPPFEIAERTARRLVQRSRVDQRAGG